MRNSPLGNENQQANIRGIIKIIPPVSKRKLLVYQLVQIALNALDVLSVALMGAIAALAINGIQSKPAGNKVQKVLEVTQLDGFTFQTQIGLLGSSAVLLMLFKVLLQYIVSKRILNLLFNVSIDLSKSLLSDGLEKKTRTELDRPFHEIQHAIGYGINATTIGTLGVLSTVISDTFLLALIGLLILMVDPLSFILSFLLFGILSLILYKRQNNRAYQVGKLQSELNISGNAQIENIFRSYREIYLNGKQEYYVEKSSNLRKKFREVYITQTLMPNLGKYTVEVSIAVSTLAMAAYQFSTQNAVHAAANLSIFLAAGSRIAPALLRIQNGLVTLKGNLGQISPTLKLLKERNRQLSRQDKFKEYSISDLVPNIEIKNLDYKFRDATEFNLKIDELQIFSGQMVAIVGKSGSGKTTLVDLMLGLRLPQRGTCNLSGMPARNAVEKWPGKIAYVPQNVEIFDGTLAENVAIGLNPEEINEKRVVELLTAVGIYEEISGASGIWGTLDSKQSGMSGGQRQRLGIARALYQQPKLIVLDEATSALDGESELEITRFLASLRSTITIVAIAHRISTVVASDKVVFMENGRVAAVGSYEELKELFKNDTIKTRILGLQTD